ncbi:MAG: homocysteine S-methyltransferase family protein [Bacteroidetes bacterium]|nr:homocysteine S-methyltransferase family protein [Bacteroidota bacterium]
MLSPASLLAPTRPVLFDGGFGACLQHRGLEPGSAPEGWNVSRPDDVRTLHSEFVAAGSLVIETNTFGANVRRFQSAEVKGKISDNIRAAVRLATEAAGHRAIIAGSAGPLGELIEPYGELSAEDARAAFTEPYRTMREAGVRVLLIETMMSLEEAQLALECAHAIGFDIVGATMTFEPTPHGPRTAFGVSPTKAARELVAAGAQIVGSNCGSGFDTMRQVAKEFVAASSVPVLIQPNAGIPRGGANGPVYPESPESFGAFLAELHGMGVKLLGGCCGAEPEHIAAAAARLQP